jgi:O-antigen/teichoic acid export membrane protein
MIDLEESSISNRAIFSVIFNIIRAGIGFSTAMLLAKWLGPEGYGRLAFLIASLLAVRGLIDMSTSQAFFTFLSQRPRSKTFVNFFLLWILFQLAMSVIVTAFILPDSYIDSLWQGEARSLVVLALIAVFMQHQVWQVALSMAEASRRTVRVQSLTLVVTFSHLLIIVGLWVWGQLLLPFIFWALIFEWTVASFVAANMYAPSSENTSKDTIQSVSREFWRYCKPLIPYAWIGFFYVFIDRWLLQLWAGSEEQAFYAVAIQISAVCLIATGAVLKIFWKEIAEAFKKNDIALIQYLYTKTSRILYVVSAILIGSIVPWAEEVLVLILGAPYSQGAVTFAIMLFYPLHQSLGQICGTVFYATEHNKIQANIGYVFMATSMIVTYLLLAPTTSAVPGLGLQSNGLAIKMLVMQFIQVTASSYIITRLFNLKFDLLHQIIVLALVLVLSFISKFAVSSVLSLSLVSEMIIATLCYLSSMLVILISFPSLISLNRGEIIELGSRLFRKR